MKSLIALSCAFATISVGSLAYWASTPAAAVPEPPPVRRGVHFVEAEVRLGVVGLNANATGTFTIVNDTDAVVSLGEPMKSCSCTATTLERYELAPGERCSLAFTVHTGARRVPRAENILLPYAANGGDPRQLHARVLFEPKGVFSVEPAELTLTRANPKATLVVRGDPSAERHDVLAVRANHPCVKVDTRSLPTVTLELDPAALAEAMLNVECTVYTNNPAEDTIRVPVRVRK